MAHVRLQDLCDRLDVTDDELHKKMWTCLEFIVMHHTELLKDRHLDQIVMCAVYVIAKVRFCWFTTCPYKIVGGYLDLHFSVRTYVLTYIPKSCVCNSSYTPFCSYPHTVVNLT